MVVAGLSQTPTGGGHDALGQDALGPAGGRGGVRQEQRVLGVEELGPVLRSAMSSAARLKSSEAEQFAAYTSTDLPP